MGCGSSKSSTAAGGSAAPPEKLTSSTSSASLGVASITSNEAAGGVSPVAEEPPAWSVPVELKPYKTKKATDGQGAVVPAETRSPMARSESTSSRASAEYKSSVEGRTHAPAGGGATRPGTNSPEPAAPTTEPPAATSTEPNDSRGAGSVIDYSIVRAGPPGKKRAIKPAHLSDGGRPNQRHPSAKAKPKPRALHDVHRQPLLKGKCFVCKKPVFDTQPRVKEEQGYRHETCVAVTLSEGVADAAMSNASTNKTMADVRAAERERIEAERVAMEQASLAMRDRLRKNADLRKKSQDLNAE